MATSDFEYIPPEVKPSEPKALIHPISATILIAIDSLWGVFDFAPVVWIFTIPLCFFACSIPIYFIQKFLNKDASGHSAAVALVCGVLAALPMPVMGNAVGAAVLAWAGMKALRK